MVKIYEELYEENKPELLKIGASKAITDLVSRHIFCYRRNRLNCKIADGVRIIDSFESVPQIHLIKTVHTYFNKYLSIPLNVLEAMGMSSGK